MKISLSKQTEHSLPEQIFQSVSDRIRSGLIAEGERLPSVRKLADQLEVSLVTVQKAYELLEKKQLIERRQGKGSYVKRSVERIEQSNPYNWQNMIEDFLPRAQTWKEMKSFSRQHKYNLSIANLAHDLLPVEELTNISTKVIRDEPTILTSYSPGPGDHILREVISDYLVVEGLNVSPNKIVITSGAQQGLELIAKTFLGVGDVVFVEAPTYIGIIDIFKSRGVTIKTIPTNEDGMNLNVLLQMCEQFSPKFIYTNPTFQNPTGTTLSEKKRRRLVEIAQAFQVIIMEDDPWGELRFEAPTKPMKSMDENGHVIYLKSFSKPISPGFRVGCIVADGKILNKLKAAKSVSDLGSPLLNQRIIARFIQSFNFESHFKKMNKLLLLRRNLLINALNELNIEGLKWTIPNGGPVMWITFPSHVNTEHLLIDALKQELLFMPSAMCYPNEPEVNHLRISYGNLSLNTYKEALDVFKKVVQDHMEGLNPFTEDTPLF
ncbi:MocR-like pyridoxine biosynthesis transcription factor PdxR [Chengkuizengella axinellae]|uniref:PLP-dependent aminotransferase family protein n=1 Tax=Chengkuizengella axinellae TaxID=3064388 RepID=A0ABT9J2X8_9BACL|nr:PLP-dependent aminotransferase family protein [Chengkuizengella sp. 2205SS18-9]MDP5275981.1 PLP-dependent aminotransferase family protein [Chengkuizengella sp. 2205SS18-9]